jgi:hypothetical protein
VQGKGCDAAERTDSLRRVILVNERNGGNQLSCHRSTRRQHGKNFEPLKDGGAPPAHGDLGTHAVVVAEDVDWWDGPWREVEKEGQYSQRIDHCLPENVPDAEVRARAGDGRGVGAE